MKKLLTFILLISFQSAHALLYFEDASSPELITSARALAMGGAYMSKVDDGWAAFYNPAGLGSVRKLQFHLTNIHLETNNGFLDITGGSGSFFESVSNYSDAFSADGVRNLLADNPGNISHARFNFFPNLTYRGITIGWMYSQQQRARIKSADDKFEIAERVDYGPVLSFSASLFGGIIKFGATGIILTRKQMSLEFDSTESTDIDVDRDYKKGTMTHLTAATRITIPVFMLPTFSLVVRNSSQAQWYDPEHAGVPDQIPSTVDGSFSLTPFASRTSRLHFEIGAKDMGNRYTDVPNNRKVMGGFELDMYRTFFFRGGFGDGWGSGGIGVRNDKFIFDLTTYAIEASQDGYRQEEDRRYVLNLAMGF
jgi:hypothetical protein